ncbi:MAG: hypothetical protein ACTSQE_17025 [Candidatus Heimdallarchaeaceae archaeon]
MTKEKCINHDTDSECENIIDTEEDDYFYVGKEYSEFWTVGKMEGKTTGLLCWDCYEAMNTGLPADVVVYAWMGLAKYEVAYDITSKIAWDLGHVKAECGEIPEDEEGNYNYSSVTGLMRKWIEDILKATKWTSTDAWRGFCETDEDELVYVQSFKDMVHLWGRNDNEEVAREIAKRLKMQQIPFMVVVYRTSNVFSLCSTHFVPKEYANEVDKILYDVLKGW